MEKLADDENFWYNSWSSASGHIPNRTLKFELLKKHIIGRPQNILDIGCGLAYVAEFFQKEFDSFLYLLDGDFESTKNKTRDISYGPASDFKFYTPVSKLRESFDLRKLRYDFINAESPSFKRKIEMDVIVSTGSCGFHYPVTTYKELIKSVSKKDTQIFMELRKGVPHEGIKITRKIHEFSKSVLCELIIK